MEGGGIAGTLEVALSIARVAGGAPLYYVYMLASRRNGTLYVGMTNDLRRRVEEHKRGAVEGFTKHYKVHRLVWFEATETARSAITREKQINKWRRGWKVRLLEASNPRWTGLYDQIFA